MTIKTDSFVGQKMTVLPEKSIKGLNSNPLTSTLYFSDIGYFPTAKYHYRNRNDGSIHNILIYCVEGEGWISINGKRKKMGKDQYCFIPRNIPHSYAASEENPWTIYWFHFGGSNADSFVGESTFPEIISSDESMRDQRKALFNEILSLMQASFPEKNLEYANFLLGHLLATFRYEYLIEGSHELNDNPVNRSITFMKQNLENKIKLHELAALSRLSVSHFSLIFKKQTSQAPMEYLNNLRIQQACHLLDLSERKIKEIAQDVGFPDALYFSRIFTRIMGRSPRHYREVRSG